MFNPLKKIAQLTPTIGLSKLGQLSETDGLTNHIGVELKAKRLARGVTLGEVSQSLCVSLNYLEAIEQMDRHNLPARGYALGFVSSYANYLGLDKGLVVEQFKAQIGDHRTAPRKPRPEYISKKEIKLPRGTIAASMVLSSLFVVAGWYGFKSDANSAPTTQSVTRPQAVNMDQDIVPQHANLDMVALRAIGPSWVHVEDKEGNILISRVMVIGDIFEINKNALPLLSLRDAGAIVLYRGGVEIGPIGQKGAKGKNIPLF